MGRHERQSAGQCLQILPLGCQHGVDPSAWRVLEILGDTRSSRRNFPPTSPLEQPELKRVVSVSPATSHLDIRLSVRPSFAAPDSSRVKSSATLPASPPTSTCRPGIRTTIGDAAMTADRGRLGKSRVVRVGPPAVPPPVTAARSHRRLQMRCPRCLHEASRRTEAARASNVRQPRV